ncbi:MAG: glycosyltransferase family 1 protein [Myxococcales bacterium]|nr:glycosyltransferase family 1 protein [Myxococcales bacterium]
MRRILLAAHPTIGHISALRAIGVQLRDRGHTVGFATTRVRLPISGLWPAPLQAGMEVESAIRSHGLEVLPLSPSPGAIWYAARLPWNTGHDELAVAIELFTVGLGNQAREIAAWASRMDADVIVGDYLMPAAMLAAGLVRRPYVALYHSALPFPVDGAAPFGSGLGTTDRGSPAWIAAEAALRRLERRFDDRVQRAADALGLSRPAAQLLTRPLSPDLNLLATSPQLEPGLQPLDGPVQMIGPCLPSLRAGGAPSHPSLDVLPPDGLRVYVSLGTVMNGKPRIYDQILDGLAILGASVVVSAGTSLRRLSVRRRARTWLYDRVPQVALLPQVDLVVTHGGQNTVQECLALGKPMLVVPFGGDQIENAARVERLGVGEALNPNQLDRELIRDAAARVVAKSHLRSRALATSLGGADGARDGAAAILEFLMERERRRAAVEEAIRKGDTLDDVYGEPPPPPPEFSI